MSGRKAMARKAFSDALKLAEKYRFSVEYGYAKRLLKAYERSGKDIPVNFP